MEEAPYCLSERSGMAEFDMPELRISELLNQELIIDLFGVFKIGQKGKEEMLMLPIASTQIDLPKIAQTLSKQGLNTTDVVANFTLE